MSEYVYIIFTILFYITFVILFYTLYNSNNLLKKSEELLKYSENIIHIIDNNDCLIFNNLYIDGLKLQSDLDKKKNIFLYKKLNCDNICKIQCNIDEVISISKLQNCDDYCKSKNLIFDGNVCIGSDINKFIKDVNIIYNDVNELHHYNPILI
jgi:hypothetical protein